MRKNKLSKLSIPVFMATLIISFSLFTVSSSIAELVAYWPFDEGSGEEVIDATGNGYDGTFQGDPEWTNGTQGTALEFDGNDYVDVPGVVDVNPESITVAAWVYFNRVAGYRQDFLSRGDDYGFTLGGHEEDMRVHAVMTTDGDWLDMIGDTVVEVGNWYYVALTYDDGADMFTLYLNGEIDAEQEVATGLEHRLGGSLTIGTYNDRYLEGKLDEIKIWDAALSIDEIREVMDPASVEPSGKLSISWGAVKSSI